VSDECGPEVVWLGHATVDVRLGGGRFVTDPVLRDRVGHLRRHSGTRHLGEGGVDAVLISHLHHDHLDVPSLRALPSEIPIVVPFGAASLVARSLERRRGPRREVIEVGPGDEITVAGVRISVVPASHSPGRTGRRVRAAPVGYVFEHSAGSVYFPGDTDLHPIMADLPAPDVALLPIWGWGRSLGEGHLDPPRAAMAATQLRAGAVLPIHWGTFAPVRIRSRAPGWLGRPADEFAAAMQHHAPDVAVHLVAPGPTPIRFGSHADDPSARGGAAATFRA